MSGFFEKLAQYWAHPFVRYALVVGVLVALCASLLGVILVLKRYSLIGDGLSRVAFGAAAAATAVGLASDMLFALPVTIVFAVLLLRNGGKGKLSGDAVVAMLSVGSLAFGYLVINLFSASANVTADVCSTLFGSISILTLSQTELWLSILMSALVLAVFVLFYHRIFSVTFDEDFAAATGVRAGRVNFVVAVTIAVIIVLSMNLVGSLLITALILFPALSAMRLCKSFRAVVVCSAFIAVFCAALGILLSIVFGTPVGATIVMVNLSAFALFSLFGIIKGGIST